MAKKQNNKKCAPNVIKNVAKLMAQEHDYNSIRTWTPHTIDDGCADAEDCYFSRLFRMVSYLNDEPDRLFAKKAKSLVLELLDDDMNYGMTRGVRHRMAGRIMKAVQQRMPRDNGESFNAWLGDVIDARREVMSMAVIDEIDQLIFDANNPILK